MPKPIHKSEIIVLGVSASYVIDPDWYLSYFTDLDVVALSFKDEKTSKSRIAVFNGVEVINASDLDDYLERKSRQLNKITRGC